MAIQPPQMPPQFGGRPVPQIGQRQKQLETHIIQAIGQTSQTMYLQLATAYLAGLEEHQEVDLAKMRQRAKDSMAVAKAYFEGIGAIEVEEETGDAE